jgi:hypothetical protein
MQVTTRRKREEEEQEESRKKGRHEKEKERVCMRGGCAISFSPCFVVMSSSKLNEYAGLVEDSPLVSDLP